VLEIGQQFRAFGGLCRGQHPSSEAISAPSCCPKIPVAENRPSTLACCPICCPNLRRMSESRALTRKRYSVGSERAWFRARLMRRCVPSCRVASPVIRVNAQRLSPVRRYHLGCSRCHARGLPCATQPP
jgi:hypothetical protein